MSEKCEMEFDAEIQKFAEENINETKENRENGMKEITRWLIEEKPNLNARLEPRYIIPFLRLSKFNIEDAKVRLINYYNLRRDNAIWFTNRDPKLPELEEIIKLGVFVPLKQLYKNQMVVIIRTAAHNPKIHSQETIFKVDHMILDVAALFEFEIAQIFGLISVFDMNGVTFWHAKALTPNIVKRAVAAWQHYHIASKSYEFINSPGYLNVILNIFKSFMTDSMKKSTKVHTNGLKSLHTFVDKEILPEEYGGSAGKLEDLINFWHDKVLSKRDWFLEDNKYRSD
ncbi:retinol-binding protein pinta-like [Diorhabda carinulata]|uniref:retinol-binding protein pinta-like n=1 Tax=Diorhabda carinulata TaxID=1163345 RepID=UPI0025A168C8|nr:retinol-binding protein pinta-like [Diorhabda carinulata]XP_057666281.1 retinol-binding protein pinta-like [Diorhabda carinulata]XP_057666282.1 retinol-binding protein pinta-like [Diorhabda carinulata]XP_057666283.1 retinol-binding protein pinta-like [Diorhabda carinulata]